MASFDVNIIRARFPALIEGNEVYLENAGGSQCLGSVIDAISSYLSSTNVQLGATYATSQISTDLVAEGTKAAARYINAAPSETVFGPSTTQLFRNLSIALFNHIHPGDDIIISALDHEANIASWLTLAKWRGANVIWWTLPQNTQNPHLTAPDLQNLLTPKTKLVTLTHTSNVLGSITDIPSIAKAVHTVPGALLCVDAVAYAPHRRVDVKALGADFYAFSWYKVYGPHVASLYASSAAQKCLETLGHFFHPTDTLGSLLGLGSGSYEAVASVPKVVEYLEGLDWEQIALHEEKLQGVLLEYLASKPEVFTVWGEKGKDKGKRVPVVSFTVKGVESKSVVDGIEKKGKFACRNGAMYSNRLLADVLGLDTTDGVVRVSMVHYNTVEEIEGFVQALDGVVSAK